MFARSQFDATSAFSGGGFMASQSADIMDSTPPAKPTRETQPLVPLTVKQLSEASQSSDEKSNYVINGVDISNVTLVGMIFDKNVRSSDIRFYLDDGTGRVLCIRWMAESSDTREMDGVEDGRYVRLCGRLQSFQGEKQLATFSLRAITNFDEVTCHFIECIHFNVQNSKLQLQGGTTDTLDPSLITPVRPASNVSKAAPSNDLSMQFSTDGLKSFDKMVLNYLQQPANIEREMGIHVDEISQQLKVPTEKIRDAIDFLEREGLVYSSVDDYHYKAVEGC